MTARQVKIRDGVYGAITAAQNSYVLVDFDIEKTYFPKENLEDLAAKPKVKIIGMNVGTARDRELRRTTALTLEIPVQVCIQQKVSPTDTLTIDELVEFCEQVMTTCEDDQLVSGENYSYTRTEPLKDENGLEFSYDDLSSQGVFQSIFTVFYTTIKE